MNGESPNTFPVIVAFVEVVDGRLRFKLTQLEASWTIWIVESPKTKLLSC
jgi:hypothetical protein